MGKPEYNGGKIQKAYKKGILGTRGCDRCKQKERIENAKEKRAEEKKEQAAKAQKKTYVQANSLEELEKKIKEIDWDSVKETKQETEGSRFDYSV